MASVSRPSQTRAPIDLGTASTADLVQLPGPLKGPRKRSQKWNRAAADKFVQHRNNVLATKQLQSLQLIDLIGSQSPLTENMLKKWKQHKAKHRWILLNNTPVVELFDNTVTNALRQRKLQDMARRSAAYRAAETSEQSSQRKQRDAEATAAARAFETPQKTRNRTAHVADSMAALRATETPEQTRDRQQRDAGSTAAARTIETPEQTRNRQQRNAESTAAARTTETPEQTRNRHQRNAESTAASRAAETPEQTRNRQQRDANSTAAARSSMARQRAQAQQQNRPIHEFLNESEDKREAQIMAELERLKQYENMPERLASKKDAFDIAVQTFNDSLMDYPKNICVSCERMLHHSQGKDLTDNDLWDVVVKICEPNPNIPHRDPVPWKWVCNTCLPYIKKKKLPKLAMANNLRVPLPPDVIRSLDPIECRMVKQVVPFQTIVQLGYARSQLQHQSLQTGAKGLSICLASDVLSVCSKLPRQNNAEVGMIFVRPALPRDVAESKEDSKEPEQKYVHLSEEELSVSKNIVRPDKILNALKYFKENNVLYSDVEVQKLEGVFNSDRRDDVEQASQFYSIMDDPNPSANNIPESHADYKIPFYRLERIEGTIINDRLVHEALEAYAFPEIYHTGVNHFGTDREVPLTEQEYGELRMNHYSRFWANNHQWVFLWKSVEQKKQLRDAVSNTLRKKTPSKDQLYAQRQNLMLQKSNRLNFDSDQLAHKVGFDYTRSDAITKEQLMEDLESKEAQDDSLLDQWQFLQGIRGTPAFWQAFEQCVMSLARKHGPASIWLTLTANEFGWVDLLIQLSNGTLTKDDVERMSKKEKEKLLHDNQAMAAEAFQRRLLLFIKTVLQPHAEAIFGFKIAFFQVKIEFQGRGTPHGHILLWLVGWSQYLDDPRIQKWFVDHWIPHVLVWRKPDIQGREPNEEEAQILEALQWNQHSHSVTCGKPCRFYYPKPESSVTRFVPPGERKSLKLKPSEFYLLQRGKRTEQMQEPINPRINCVFRSNGNCTVINGMIGLQRYLAKYFSKSESVGLGDYVRKSIEKLPPQAGFKSRLWHAGRTVLNARVASVQECTYLLRGRGMNPLHLTISNVSFQHIQTMPDQFCTKHLKSPKELARLGNNSKDLYRGNVTTRYKLRPKETELPRSLQDLLRLKYFEDLSLLEWAEHFVRVPDSETDHLDTFQDSNVIEDARKQTRYRLEPDPHSGRCGYVYEARTARIAKYAALTPGRWGDLAYYALAKLHLPWRIEPDDIMNGHSTAVDALLARKESLLNSLQSSRLETYLGILKLIAEVEEEQKDDFVERLDIQHPDLAQQMIERENMLTRANVIFDVLDLNQFDESHLDSMLLQEAGLDGCETIHAARGSDDAVSDESSVDPTEHITTVDELRERLEKIAANAEQMKVFAFVHSLFLEYKNSDAFRQKQIRNVCRMLFITGGAGAGKSFVIDAIVGLARCMLGADPLLIAPTGFAATHIRGRTAWCFGLPIYEIDGDGNRPYVALENYAKRNEVIKLGRRLLIAICDEVSMLSSDNLAFIQRRLMEANNCDKFMGSLEFFFFVGDLRQLQPVKQPWIFQPTSRRAQRALQQTTNDPIWMNHVELLEIKGSMRQQGDASFLDLLNYLGEKTQDEKVPDKFIGMIKSRMPVSKGGKLPVNAHRTGGWLRSTHLFAKNTEVKDQNNAIIDAIADEGKHRRLNIPSQHRLVEYNKTVVAHSKISMQPLLPEHLVTFYRGSRDNDIRKGGGLPRTLRLVEGPGRWMITRNIDTSDGLVNGAVANEIKYISRTADGRAAIGLKFSNARTGKNNREKYDSEWVLIFPTTSKISGEKPYQHVKMERCGFPIRPAWGLTIDKSQGDTLDRGVVDLKNVWVPQKAPGAYVALSRFRNLEDFIILSMPWKKAFLLDVCRDELKRLRETRVPAEFIAIAAHVDAQLQTQEHTYALIEEILQDCTDATWLFLNEKTKSGVDDNFESENTASEEPDDEMKDSLLVEWNEHKTSYEQEVELAKSVPSLDRFVVWRNSVIYDTPETPTDALIVFAEGVILLRWRGNEIAANHKPRDLNFVPHENGEPNNLSMTLIGHKHTYRVVPERAANIIQYIHVFGDTEQNVMRFQPDASWFQQGLSDWTYEHLPRFQLYSLKKMKEFLSDCKDDFNESVNRIYTAFLRNDHETNEECNAPKSAIDSDRPRKRRRIDDTQNSRNNRSHQK